MRRSSATPASTRTRAACIPRCIAAGCGRCACSPAPAVRIVTDMIEFTATHVPRWNPVSISGYHIREAGSTAVQELAFTLADGLAYVEAALARGLDVDSFAPRLSFFFDVHNDFFEEIAKPRGAPPHWARFYKGRDRAEKPRLNRLGTPT